MNTKVGKERGMTLIELLVVVAVLGIIAAIAIPRLQKATRAANQASAVESLRTITTAEINYRHADANTTYASLGTLADQNLIDGLIGGGGGSGTMTGAKSGYLFQITLYPPDSQGNPHFVLSAIPSTTFPGLATGYRRFGTDDTGVLYNDLQTIDTHYTTKADLTSGTSVVFEP